MSPPPSLLHERVRAWKASGYEVYRVTIPGVPEPCVIRALTREEHEALVESLDPASYYAADVPFLGLYGTLHYVDVLKVGLLHPVLTDGLPAGVDAHIARVIAEISGWTTNSQVQSSFERARQKATRLWDFLETRILLAFPAMKGIEVRNLTLDAFMDKVAQSEIMTGVEIDLRPWLDPQGYMKEVERQEKRARRSNSTPAPDPRARKAHERMQLVEAAEEMDVELRTNLSRRVERPNFERDNRRLGSV